MSRNNKPSCFQVSSLWLLLISSSLLQAHCHWRLRCKPSQDGLCDVDYSKDNTIAYHSRLTSPCFDRADEGGYRLFCCEDKVQDGFYF